MLLSRMGLRVAPSSGLSFYAHYPCSSFQDGEGLYRLPGSGPIGAAVTSCTSHRGDDYRPVSLCQPVTKGARGSIRHCPYCAAMMYLHTDGSPAVKGAAPRFELGCRLFGVRSIQLVYTPMDTCVISIRPLPRSVFPPRRAAHAPTILVCARLGIPVGTLSTHIRVFWK